MTAEGSAPVDLFMRPLPIGLEGLEVSVDHVDREAVRLLRLYRHIPASPGRRWIDRETIDKGVMALTPAHILRWQALPGFYVPVGKSLLMDPLCVKTHRNPVGPCALTVLNGAVIDPLRANQIAPDEIEAIAILTPMDATTFYGTIASGGPSSYSRGKGEGRRKAPGIAIRSVPGVRAVRVNVDGRVRMALD